MLRLTLLRPVKSRGRDGGAPHDDEKLAGIAQNLREMCNGDLRLRTMAHFCPPDCCKATGRKNRRMVAVERTTMALSDAWFNGLGCQCAQSKWYTFEPVLSQQVGGMLWCQVLPRAVQRVGYADE